jgi:hypothetical protein
VQALRNREMWISNTWRKLHERQEELERRSKGNLDQQLAMEEIRDGQ